MAIEKQAEKDGRKYPQDQEIWVYRTKKQLEEDLCGMWGRTALDAALTVLVELGFVEQRHDPVNPWNRTLQYRLRLDKVLPAIEQFQESDNAMESQILEEEAANGSTRESTGDGQIEDPKPAVDSEKNGEHTEENNTPPGVPPGGIPSGLTDEEFEAANELCMWLTQLADEKVRPWYPAAHLLAAGDLLRDNDKRELKAVIEWAASRRWWAPKILTAPDVRRHWRKMRAEFKGSLREEERRNGGGKDAARHARTEARLRGESL